jgi:predicted negative regulator of RcsB-dependent stress response
VIIGACAVIAIAAIGFGVYSYMQYRDRLAAGQFYEAVAALNHKDYKTAEADFSRLARDRPGASLGRLARFYLASSYMAEKDPAKARDTLNEYLADDDRPLFKSLALIQLGVAYEDLGQFQQAHQAYGEAAKMPGPEKMRAELGVARMLVREGHKDAAIAAYRQFLTENQFATERGDVLEALAELGVPPETQNADALGVGALAKPAPAFSPGASGPASATGKPATSPAVAAASVAPHVSAVSGSPGAAGTSATPAAAAPQPGSKQKN